MFTVYRVRADELDDRFLQSVRAAFRDEPLEITVSSADETAYLLASPANRDHLLRAVADVEEGRNLVTPDQSVFQ
ncbi:MAG: hypothetical protein COZ06_33470 [Armatimonadetes bacterium CG_4_10_14_3_um_filter_66_18]|nr:MAG: hypothetical protein COZ06_33470 [Armatimonadetes bacterium CG_4_10_14_3_um_filter_66_18]